MAIKLGKLVACLEWLTMSGIMFRDLVRSLDELNSFFLHYHNIYDYKTRMGGE